MSEDARVEQTIRLAAGTETVFRYLTDPGLMSRWIGRNVRLAAEPGGELRIDVNGIDVVRGEILEVQPERKLVFTWGWENPGSRLPPGSSVVEITLERDGEETILHLLHRDLRPEDRAEHDKGWAHYLDRLSIAVTGGEPGPDPIGDSSYRHGYPS